METVTYLLVACGGFVLGLFTPWAVRKIKDL